MLRIPPAPTYHLADQLYRVYERQLRKILLPAMQNIIKRIMSQGRAGAMNAVASTCTQKMYYAGAPTGMVVEQGPAPTSCTRERARSGHSS